MNSTADPTNGCYTSIPWWTSYAISAGIFVLGLLINGIISLIQRLKRNSNPTIKMELLRRKSRLLMNSLDTENDSDITEAEEETGISSFTFLEFSIWCERIISHRSSIGKITTLFLVVSNLLSWAIYLYFSSFQTTINYLQGDCYRDTANTVKWIDFGLNIFFALHFLLRILAAVDKIKFWILPTTFIDLLIIPNVFISTFLPVRRQGLGFVRIFYFRYIYEVICVNFGIVGINSKTKVFNLSAYLISIWLLGSGLMHMEENTGDFWSTVNYKQNWTYWESTYFLLVTVSTVGYGDYFPRTISGQIIVCFYIIYAITLFAISLPEIINTMKNNSYNDRYVTRNGERHMIVTGQFINSTIKIFLKVFINKQTRKRFRNTKIIIMNDQPCDRILSLYLKKFSSSIVYLVGSIQNIADMKRVNVQKSKAIVILSLPYTNKIHDEDSDNIMTAISLKAQKENIRTIVQLHLYSNKILLKMFPRWNKYRKDVIICLDELRLGLMAYNCLVPGLAALITNLMAFTQPKKSENQWRKEYEEGLRVRLYSVEFSDDFHGMPCLDVALLIYKLWDVCLLAVKYVKNNELNEVIINPMIDNKKIDTSSMIAIVMARDEVLAHRVSFYCSNCSATEPLKLCDCLLKATKKNVIGMKKVANNFANKRLNQSLRSSYLFSMMDFKPYKIVKGQTETDVDITETFYWTSSPQLEDICIDVVTAEKRHLSDHILLCLCGSGEGTIDLCNFMMPLRFRALPNENLRTIVILGSRKYFENNKWSNIKNFPMFLIINGSPIQARDLRAAGLFDCYACAIINGNDDSNDNSDKQSLICATLVRSMIKDHRKEFSMITEIREDEVACHFSSTEAFDIDNKMPVQQSEPYAGGLLFTNSILYKCIYSIYHNPDTFSFVSALINGSRGELVEKMFGSGVGLLPKKSITFDFPTSDTIFQLLSFDEEPLNAAPNLNEGTLLYEEFFEWALRKKRILCLGLYRLNFGKHRYVFTHPPKSTEIFLSDKIFCNLVGHSVPKKLKSVIPSQI